MAKSSVPRWIARGLVGAGLLVLALLATGAVYQWIGEVRDRAELGPPGQLVEVDGHLMHIHCTGRTDGPTVVLEAGAAGFAQTWAWVQGELSTTARVCSYDRAGMGWSDTWETGHDGASVARNLSALLTVVEETGPYVLVGHSLGGSFVQGFAGAHPEAVAGMVLVDPSHPDQLERFGPEIADQQRALRSMLGWAAKLAHFGVLRATNLIGRNAVGLPDDAYRAARMFASSPTHLGTSHAELVAWDSTTALARGVRSLGDLPLVVVSATESMEGIPNGLLEVNLRMHEEMAGTSSGGRHVPIEGSDHLSLLMDQDDARQTAALIAEVVQEARSRISAGYTPDL